VTHEECHFYIFICPALFYAQRRLGPVVPPGYWEQTHVHAQPQQGVHHIVLHTCPSNHLPFQHSRPLNSPPCLPTFRFSSLYSSLLLPFLSVNLLALQSRVWITVPNNQLQFPRRPRSSRRRWRKPTTLLSMLIFALSMTFPTDTHHGYIHYYNRR
jgi:hypothetical protein